MALGIHCSVYHLTVTTFCMSDTTRCIIAFDLKNAFFPLQMVIFWQLWTYAMLTNSNCVLRFIVIWLYLVINHNIVNIRRLSLIEYFKLFSAPFTRQVFWISLTIVTPREKKSFFSHAYDLSNLNELSVHLSLKFPQSGGMSFACFLFVFSLS